MKHVTFAIGSLYGGGAERVVSVWASALAEKGYRVSILVYSRVDNEYPIHPNIEVCPIANSQKECNELSMLNRVKLFRKLLKDLKPNVVVSFLPAMQVYIYLASIGLKIPRIETIRINPWMANSLSGFLKKLWLRCFRTCNALILQSKDQKSFFTKKIQKKSVVIPNPINSRYIENLKTNYYDKSHKIVAAGRLSDQKNYKMMIDAVAKVKLKFNDVSLDIYGLGEKEEEIKQYLKDIGLEDTVHLMGRSNQLYNVYKDADLYLMSSDYEGMPNALAEAMAIGLPCISTDCKTGPRDLIDDGVNGYLVPCGDVDKLAEKIEKVFSMTSEEQKNLGQKAREKIMDFCSEENSLNKLIKLIENI